MQLKNQRFFLWLNQLIFPLFYLAHQGKSSTVIDAGGAKFQVRVNTSDILVIWEIWKAKIYDDARFPIQPDDIVVDIGAHIGGFALRAAKQAWRGKIFAYEASARNFSMLAENRKLNNAENLHIENMAVSSRHGEMRFSSPGDNGALGSLLQEAKDSSETVQATTLADIVIQNHIEQIDFLKIDVEGAEYDILTNCPKEALAKVRFIVMEYHEFQNDRRNRRDLMHMLQVQGFHVAVEGGIFLQNFLFGTGIIKAWRD